MPNSEELLMKVAAFATHAHAGQMRKYANEPYIEHPVRVLHTCMIYNLKSHSLFAALLHDVIEDTKISEEQLTAFLRKIFTMEQANRILELVIQLTDVFTKKAYPHWNRRIRKAAELERLKKISAEAQTVKYADILDNTTGITAEDPDFAKVLLNEYQQQLETLTDGDPSLRDLAKNKVKEELEIVLRSSR